MPPLGRWSGCGPVCVRSRPATASHARVRQSGRDDRHDRRDRPARDHDAPTRIHADRGAGTLEIEWADGHATVYGFEAAALALPVRILPRRGRHAGLARQRPDADAAADPAHRPAPGRQLRRLAALGRRPRDGLLPVPSAARSMPVPGVHRPPPARERPTPSAARPPPGPTRSIDDHRHDAVPHRPSHRREQGHGVRTRRPQPRPRRQPHGRPALARRRRDPRVHEPARGHAPPGARSTRPQRDGRRRERGRLDALRLVGAVRHDVGDRGLRHRRHRRARRLTTPGATPTTTVE